MNDAAPKPSISGIFKNIPKPLLTGTKLLVTLLIILFVIKKLGWTSIIDTCVQMNPLFALYGLIACIISIFLGAFQWHLLLHRKDLKITFRETIELYYIGMFFNNVGMLAGDTIKVAYIKQRHLFGKLGFAATFLDRFAGLLALSAFAGIGCTLLLWKGISDPTVLLIIRMTAFMVFCFGLMLAILTMRRLRRIVIAFINYLPLPKKEFLGDLVSATGLDVHHLGLVVSVGFLSVLIQALRITTHICSAAALGILTPDNLVFFFIFIPVLSLVMIVPLPFGIRETIGGTLFAVSGIPLHGALLMQFMATIIGFIGSLWGGIEFLINIPKGVHNTSLESDGH